MRQRPRQLQRLGSGDDRPHPAAAAGRLGVDGADPGVGMGTAKDGRVQGAGVLEIVEIFGAAGQHQVAIPAPDLFDGRLRALARHHSVPSVQRGCRTCRSRIPVRGQRGREQASEREHGRDGPGDV
jgi:hypothetical protein